VTGGVKNERFAGIAGLLVEGAITPSPNPLEIHAEMRAFAARNLEQAKFACDKFMEAVQTAVSAFEGRSAVAQAGAQEAGKNVMNFAQQNVAAAFDYGQKLVLAKDPQTLLALHSEFISVLGTGHDGASKDLC
jgi:hypothetical protein